MHKNYRADYSEECLTLGSNDTDIDITAELERQIARERMSAEENPELTRDEFNEIINNLEITLDLQYHQTLLP